MSASLPTVSVVVPVYNSPNDVATCIEALLEQTYPDNRHEVLVVDNDSTDETPTVVESYPVTLLRETKVQSSYAARNRGIEHATGEIVVFTDADCTPVPEWLERGVRPIAEDSADLVGGEVTFTFSDARTVAEIYDSVTNMQMERTIRSRGVAKTANLFVHANVFDDVGLFDENLQSGGDVEFTSRATKAGYELAYAPEAMVYHPARTLIPLLKKQRRVGKGQLQVWLEQDRSRLSILRSLLRGFLPMFPWTIRDWLDEDDAQSQLTLARVWVVAWWCLIAQNSGRLSRALTEVRN